VKVLPISKFDHGFVGANPIAVGLLYPARLDEARLRGAFHAALSAFDLFAGRVVERPDGLLGLVHDADAERLEIREVDEELLEAEPLASACSRELRGVPGNQLFGVTVLLGRSSTLISYRAAHLLGDGVSHALFMRAWSDAYTQEPLVHQSLQRSFLTGTVEEDAKETASRNYPLEERSAASFRRLEVVSRPVLEQSVSAIRRRIPGLSSHSAVAACLARSCLPAMLPENAVARIRTPIELRGIHSRLDWNYVGNAILDALTTVQLEPIPDAVTLAEAIDLTLKTVMTPDFVDERVPVEFWGIELESASEVYQPATDVVFSDLRRMSKFVFATFGTGVPQMRVAPQFSRGLVLTDEPDGIHIQIVSELPLAALSLGEALCAETAA
jgi:hypothetical protein